MHRSTIGWMLLLLGAGSVAEAGGFQLMVNGVATLLEPPPLVEGGEVLLPGNVVSHTLGIAVLPTQNAGLWAIGAYGRQVYLRPNATRYLREGLEVECVHPPRLQGGQLQVPVSLLADNFGLRATRPNDDRLEITGGGATVTGLREGSHPEWARVVVDLSGPAAFQWSQDAGTVTVFVPSEPRAAPGTLRKLTFDDPVVPEIAQEPTPGGTSIVIGHRSPGPALVFTLADPPRIVIDLPRALPPTPGPPRVPEALEYQRTQAWQTRTLDVGRGPVVAFTLMLPVGSGKVKLRPALAEGTVWGKEGVTTMAAREGALAAVNGGYFAYGGTPLGMVVIDGEWIKEPILGRTVLGIMRDGSVQMANVRFAGRLTLPGAGCFAIDALNSTHDEGRQTVLYTGRWNKVTGERTGATRVMLSARGEVLVVNAEGRSMEIPDGGYVFSVVGPCAAKAAQARVGTTATLELGTDPPWPGLVHALGAGPRLVANGRRYVTSATERFRSDVTGGANPQTAVGVLPNGDVLLAVADGRQGGYSTGLTLEEWADFLIGLGVKDAMSMDNGGSSTLVVGGRLVNRPSDGAERHVATALLAVRATARR